MADINYALEGNSLVPPVEETPVTDGTENNSTEGAEVTTEVTEETTEDNTDDVTTEGEKPETTEPTTPDFIEINGEKVAINDLKNGYMRQSDYTKKTQEIANFKREAEQALQLVEYLKKNPHIAQKLSEVDEENGQVPINTIPDSLNPVMAELNQLKREMFVNKLDTTLANLKSKYSDFNEVEVLNKANELGVTDLEFVYNSMRGQSMDDIIKQRVQAELAKHTESLKKSNVVSKTLINKGDTPVQKTGPTLSDAQKNAALKLGMTEEEYFKWL